MSDVSASYQSFVKDPWSNQHPGYKNSFLSFSNAPEYATPEVLLASLYRQIGLQAGDADKNERLSEAAIGERGTELRQHMDKHRNSGKSPGLLSVEGWECVIGEVIRSPRRPNEKSKQSLQLTPVTPTCAAFSMAARLKSSPWNPGALIGSCILLGSESETRANNTWKDLFEALSVTGQDDVWALFLENEFQSWSPLKTTWAFTGNIDTNSWISDWHKCRIQIPALRFAKDIAHIIKAKDFLTRRQWTSILEACIRMGLGAHSLWILRCNEELFRNCDQVLKGGEVPRLDEIGEQLATRNGFWAYGQPIGGRMQKMIREYVYGRIGLNFLLHWAVNKGFISAEDCPFKSPRSVHNFLELLKKNTTEALYSDFMTSLDTVLELEPDKLAAKKGIGKNLVEFLRHSLGQRETHERGLENYDQGYVFSRKGAYARAPWILSCGPVMILTLAYCCTRDGDGIGVRTVKDLCEHLAEYGIRISADEVSNSRLGLSLRTLGLVLDSPDAEGGMVIINPFPTRRCPEDSYG
ncbi:MAG: hypothetical protein ACR2PW_01775 [Gammaproteobacteria bacterium]